MEKYDTCIDSTFNSNVEHCMDSNIVTLDIMVDIKIVTGPPLGLQADISERHQN